MELVEGEGLAERLQAGPVPAPLAARTGADVAGALALAHARGIVHRDIKPQNLMLTPDGRVKVLDFGIARPIEGGTTVTQAGMAVGTLGYIAPEVLAGRPAGAAADAYSLGATLHHALTGAAPGPGGPDFALALPPELHGVVSHLLAPEPGGRPSAEEAEARLRAAAEGPTQVLAPAEGRTRPLVRPLPGRRWVPWAAVTAVGAGVIAAVLPDRRLGEPAREHDAPEDGTPATPVPADAKDAGSHGDGAADDGPGDPDAGRGPRRPEGRREAGQGSGEGKGGQTGQGAQARAVEAPLPPPSAAPGAPGLPPVAGPRSSPTVCAYTWLELTRGDACVSCAETNGSGTPWESITPAAEWRSRCGERSARRSSSTRPTRAQARSTARASDLLCMVPPSRPGHT